MKAKYYFSAAMLTCLLFCYGCKNEDVQPQQLVTNGNVDQGSNGLPDYWTAYYSNAGVQYHWSSDIYFSPSNSIELSIANADSTSWGSWLQKITRNIPNGKSITLTVKVKGNLTGPGVALNLYQSSSTDFNDNLAATSTYPDTPITGTFDWTTYQVTIDKVDASTRGIAVSLNMGAGTSGQVYFDNIALTVN